MPLFDFAQVYVIAFFIGSGFIILSFFLGHIHDGDSGHGDSGHSGHLDFHAHAHDASPGHLDHGGNINASHGSHDTGHSDQTGNHSHSHPNQSDTNPQARGNHSISPSQAAQNDLASNVGRLAFSLLSPMTMSLFLMFFGIVGYFSLKLFPAVGFWTILPALIAGILAIKIFKRLISLMMNKLTSSTQISEWAAVGQEAEVLSTIKNGSVGEISYVVGNKLHNGIARCSDKDILIEKGSKVIITDLDGSTAIVEPQKNFSA